MPAWLVMLSAACAPGGGDTDTVRADYSPAPPAASPAVAGATGAAAPAAGATATVTAPAPVRADSPPPSQPPAPPPQGAERGTAVLTAVRVAQQTGYERIVFEFTGALPRHALRFEPRPARCGSGDAVAPVGGTALIVRFSGAEAHRFEGERAIVTVADRDRRPNLPFVKQLTQVCDFEGEVEWLVGLESRRRYTVTTMTAPFRVVVDVF